MTKVRIIGGGLTGILAAFEAHRLGATEISIEDALDRPGGWSLPRSRNGLELRDGEFLFGASPDPIRAALEWRGLAFDEVDLHEAALCPTHEGVAGVWGAGPCFPMEAGPAHIHPSPETLGDVLRAYPRGVADRLARHCEWRLGVWVDEIHASAAPALGLDAVRVATPSSTPAPRRAAVPRDGLSGLFAHAGRALARLGVRLEFHTLVSPREAALSRTGDDVVVWAADPLALFDLAALPRPRRIGERVAAYVFRARARTPLPLTVRNFTAKGVVSALRAYEVRGETLVALECVREASDEELRRDARRLAAPFVEGGLDLGEALSANLRTRFSCPSVEAVRRLDQLMAHLDRTQEGRFVVAGWESANAAARIADMSAKLQAAMSGASTATRAA